MSGKEIEVTYEAIPEDKAVVPEPESLKEALYRVTIALKPKVAAVVHLVSNFSLPFVTSSIMCEDSKARCWISEIRGNMVTIKARTSKNAKECSGVLFVRIIDGAVMKKSPL